MSMDIQIIITLLVIYPILSFIFHDGWPMIKPICPCHVLKTSAGTTPEPWSWPKTARVRGPFQYISGWVKTVKTYHHKGNNME